MSDKSVTLAGASHPPLTFIGLATGDGTGWPRGVRTRHDGCSNSIHPAQSRMNASGDPSRDPAGCPSQIRQVPPMPCQHH